MLVMFFLFIQGHKVGCPVAQVGQVHCFFFRGSFSLKPLISKSQALQSDLSLYPKPPKKTLNPLGFRV